MSCDSSCLIPWKRERHGPAAADAGCALRPQGACAHGQIRPPALIRAPLPVRLPHRAAKGSTSPGAYTPVTLTCHLCPLLPPDASLSRPPAHSASRPSSQRLTAGIIHGIRLGSTTVLRTFNGRPYISRGANDERATTQHQKNKQPQRRSRQQRTRAIGEGRNATDEVKVGVWTRTGVGV